MVAGKKMPDRVAGRAEDRRVAGPEDDEEPVLKRVVRVGYSLLGVTP